MRSRSLQRCAAMNRTLGEQVDVRSAPSTLLVFALLCAPMLIGPMALVWRNRGLWSAVGMVVAYAVLVSSIAVRRMTLTEGVLRYSGVLFRRRYDVSSVVLIRVVRRPAPMLEWRRRGEREPAQGVMIKHFSQAAIAAIIRGIVGDRGDVQIDPSAERFMFAAGNLAAQTHASRMALWGFGGWVALLLLTIAIRGVGP